MTYEEKLDLMRTVGTQICYDGRILTCTGQNTKARGYDAMTYADEAGMFVILTNAYLSDAKLI